MFRLQCCHGPSGKREWISHLSFLALFNLVGRGYFTGTGDVSALSMAESTSERTDKMGVGGSTCASTSARVLF